MLKEDIGVVLKNKLDTRKFCGVSFVQSNLILSKFDNMMQQQAKQLTELRENPVTIPLPASSPPANLDTESDFVLIVEDNADEIVAHNIEKVTKQLSIEARDKLRRTEADRQMKKRKITLRFNCGRLNSIPSNLSFQTLLI